MKDPITVEVDVKAPLEKVWDYWTKPEHIEKWAFAADDWEAYGAENDVRPGGKFKTTMAAKDKSARFDFAGTYTNVRHGEIIEYNLDDGRHVKIDFVKSPTGTKITEIFDPEGENPIELQRDGWQEILNNFKRHVEDN